MKKISISIMVLLLVPTIAIAEDVIVSTYHPSPSGRYRQLQVDDAGMEVDKYGSLQLTQGNLVQSNGTQLAFLTNRDVVTNRYTAIGLGYASIALNGYSTGVDDMLGFGPGDPLMRNFVPVYLSIGTTGNIGIGNLNPHESLYVQQRQGTAVGRFVRYANSQNGSGLTLAHGRGIATAPGNIQSGDDLGYISFAGVTDITTTNGPVIAGIATGPPLSSWTPTSTPSALVIRTIPTSSTLNVDRIRVTEDGAVEFEGLNTAPARSIANRARIYYDSSAALSASHRFMRSEHGGAYVPMLTDLDPKVKVIQSLASRPSFVDQIPHGMPSGYRVYASVAILGIDRPGAADWDAQVRITNYAPGARGERGEIDGDRVEVTGTSSGPAKTYGYVLIIVGMPPP